MNYNFTEIQAIEYLSKLYKPMFKVIWKLNNNYVIFDSLIKGNSVKNIEAGLIDINPIDNQLIKDLRSKYYVYFKSDKKVENYDQHPDIAFLKIIDIVNNLHIAPISTPQVMYNFSNLYSDTKLDFRIYLSSDHIEPISLLELEHN